MVQQTWPETLPFYKFLTDRYVAVLGTTIATTTALGFSRNVRPFKISYGTNIICCLLKFQTNKMELFFIHSTDISQLLSCGT